jgi:hypothetical protein
MSFASDVPLGTVAAYRELTVPIILSQSIEKERITANHRESCQPLAIQEAVAAALRAQYEACGYGRDGILRTLSPPQDATA